NLVRIHALQRRIVGGKGRNNLLRRQSREVRNEAVSLCEAALRHRPNLIECVGGTVVERSGSGESETCSGERQRSARLPRCNRGQLPTFDNPLNESRSILKEQTLRAKRQVVGRVGSDHVRAVNRKRSLACNKVAGVTNRAAIA